MKVMLDTTICIALIKRKPARVLKRFTEYKVGERTGWIAERK